MCYFKTIHSLLNPFTAMAQCTAVCDQTKLTWSQCQCGRMWTVGHSCDAS